MQVMILEVHMKGQDRALEWVRARPSMIQTNTLAQMAALPRLPPPFDGNIHASNTQSDHWIIWVNPLPCDMQGSLKPSVCAWEVHDPLSEIINLICPIMVQTWLKMAEILPPYQPKSWHLLFWCMCTVVVTLLYSLIAGQAIYRRIRGVTFRRLLRQNPNNQIPWSGCLTLATQVRPFYAAACGQLSNFFLNN